MKHLILVLVLLVIGYGAWHFLPRAERSKGVRRLSRHGLRLGALVAVVLAMVAASYYLTSPRIL